VPSIIVPARPNIIVPARPTGRRPRPEGGERPLRFGIVGRLAPWKGQHVFLAAFARAFPTGDHRAVVVGGALFHDQGYEAELRALAATLGLDTRVELRGHCDDVGAELARLDVFVHASVTPEPFGRVIVEAMAAGLPVIASRAGGPMEIVDDGRTGLLVTPGDEAALAAAMQRLAGSASLRSRLGAASAEAAGCFSAQRVVDGVMGAYGEALVARHRRRH
jgi:glycosyltransferase involved in cell wall biosynthesis